jgi:hypothetical protein
MAQAPKGLNFALQQRLAMQLFIAKVRLFVMDKAGFMFFVGCLFLILLIY